MLQKLQVISQGDRWGTPVPYEHQYQLLPETERCHGSQLTTGNSDNRQCAQPNQSGDHTSVLPVFVVKVIGFKTGHQNEQFTLGRICLIGPLSPNEVNQ
jgi:hypothetical protein